MQYYIILPCHYARNISITFFTMEHVSGTNYLYVKEKLTITKALKMYKRQRPYKIRKLQYSVWSKLSYHVIRKHNFDMHSEHI